MIQDANNQVVQKPFTVAIVDADPAHKRHCESMLEDYITYFYQVGELDMATLEAVKPDLIFFDFGAHQENSKFAKQVNESEILKHAILILMLSESDARSEACNYLEETDYVIKPVQEQGLLCKVNFAYGYKAHIGQLNADLETAQLLTREAIKNTSNIGIVLETVKQLMVCQAHTDISLILFAASQRFALKCWLQFRMKDKTTNKSSGSQEEDLYGENVAADDELGESEEDYRYADIIKESLSLGKIVADIDGTIINTNNLSLYVMPLNESIDDDELTTKIDSLVIIVNSAQEKYERLIAIDEAKKLVDEKNEAQQANETKSSFLANVSHELRTPLHAILNYSKLCQRDCEKGKVDRAIEGLSTINASATRLLNLINDILDLSKLESGKYEYHFSAVDLSELVKKTTNELRSLVHEKNVEFDINLLDEIRPLPIDENKVHQVLINVLSNAIKFTPENSQITISLEYKILSQGRRATDKGTINGLWISVLDEGPGVAEDELNSIFEKFSQSKKKYQSGGTGLGLTICRDIIKGHRGKIWAENGMASGLKVIIVFPVVES